MLREDEQLAAPVAEFLEFGPLQARLERVQLRVGSVVADLPGLAREVLGGRRFPSGVDRGLGRKCTSISELVSLRIVEVVFVLFHVVQAALQLGQPAGSLGRRQVFEILEQVLLLLNRRRMDS